MFRRFVDDTVNGADTEGSEYQLCFRDPFLHFGGLESTI